MPRLAIGNKDPMPTNILVDVNVLFIGVTIYMFFIIITTTTITHLP